MGERFLVFLTTSTAPDPRIYSLSVAMVTMPIVNLFSIAWMAGKIFFVNNTRLEAEALEKHRIVTGLF